LGPPGVPDGGDHHRLDLQAGGQRFGVVFAGRLEGRFGIKVFARYPLQASAGSGEWAFAGVVRVAAAVGWRLTEYLDPEKRIRRVMQTVIDASHPMLDPALQLWRISEGHCGSPSKLAPIRADMGRLRTG
jgi:hypothetical protein